MTPLSLLAIAVAPSDERAELEHDEEAEGDAGNDNPGTALDYYLGHRPETNARELIARESSTLPGAIEHVLMSPSGFYLIIGWLADEGCKQPHYRLAWDDVELGLPADLILRHMRGDLEKRIRRGAYDYGFLAFGRSPSSSLPAQSLLFELTDPIGEFRSTAVPEVVTDKWLLDVFLELVARCESHSGTEVSLHSFLSGGAGQGASELFQAYVAQSMDYYVERFRRRPVTHSLVTVLFGTVEPAKLQPVLLHAAGIDACELIYVCNSPEHASTLLRHARTMSDLYDMMITVIVMGGNVGFGVANNVAVENAASERIFLVNPDVFPTPAHAAYLRQALTASELGSMLWGGLLFYDEQTLMHSGMFLEADVFVRASSLAIGAAGRVVPSRCQLLRVEHYDKGVPFEGSSWQRPQEVAAVSGAVMGFNRRAFEKVGGFSARYIYGHYEDADLSIRWRDIGKVAVHPFLRFIHLEAHGAKYAGTQYQGASLANRHFFSAAYGKLFNDRQARLSRAKLHPAP